MRIGNVCIFMIHNRVVKMMCVMTSKGQGLPVQTATEKYLLL